ncbi:hypothetical protein N3K63_12895 [Microbacterium sp. W1N]|uniref:DsbA family protein n=1 Tax=Microbacterium festucae TaxID=2977531 RepID=UPI0021C05A03|nr:hypothetical protein [Microbacterium festucae]MCT9821175.1 hypothetical protein [Microbacterium festucae]
MLCIVAFVVILVLSAVSAKYRRLLGKAWSCVSRRVTFRSCDTSFRDDVKNSLLAPLAVRSPRLVKPASIAIEVLAWVMVLSFIVSLYIVGRSGLNLYVYGTCDKQDGQSCSLAAQMCSIDAGTPGFWESVGEGDVLGAFGDEFTSLGDTIAAIPSRMKDWDAAAYAPADATYLGGYTAGRPVALEVLDPGCRFCAQLFRNMADSGFADTHNVTYLPYPITSDIGPRFANSPLIASYLVVVRQFESARDAGAGPTGDWHILEQLFTGEDADGRGWQDWMNAAAPDDARAQLGRWLQEAGYDADEIARIDALSTSTAVADELARIRGIVEDDIKTVAIPSLITGGRLHAGLVDADTLAGIE